MSEVQQSEHLAAGPASGLGLSVQGLSVCYWEPVTGEPVFAVREFGLKAAPGEAIGVTGVSGGGKSTLAKALLGLVNAEPGIVSGDLRIGPVPEDDTSPQAAGAIPSRRELIAHLKSRECRTWRRSFRVSVSSLRKSGSFLLLQEPRDTLNPYLPIGQLLANSLSQPADPNVETRVREILEQVELPSHVADRYPAELSTGMCQRVHLGLALSSGIRLLLADEPLIRLDLRTRAKVAELLKRLHQEQGFTMILLSHDLNLIRELTDRVLVLKGGTVVEHGSVDQVLRTPEHDYSAGLVSTFRRLYGGQAHPECDSGRCEGERDAVQVAQVRKEFPSVVAVDGVSLAIRAGESVGLLGESGCGKTTLARLLIGLDTPGAGTIALALGEAEKFRPDRAPPKAWREMRSKVQLVYQDADTSLDPRVAAGECVEEAYRIHYPGLARDHRQRLVASLFASLRLPREKSSTLARYLSGGEARRVVIAQSMAALGYGLSGDEPASGRLLIADEPTTGLDAETCMTLIEFLRDCREEMRLTLLVISHELPIVRWLCGRVAVMFRGKLVETGPHDIVREGRLLPRHPFSEQLLAASRGGSAELIRDSELFGLAETRGCPFHPHCHHSERSEKRCSESPPLRGTADHKIACWFEDPGSAIQAPEE